MPPRMPRSPGRCAQSSPRADVALLDDLRPRQLAAWRAARAHLLAYGIWPAVPGHVEHALKRRGWWSQ